MLRRQLAIAMRITLFARALFALPSHDPIKTPLPRLFLCKSPNPGQLWWTRSALYDYLFLRSFHYTRIGLWFVMEAVGAGQGSFLPEGFP